MLRLLSLSALFALAACQNHTGTLFTFDPGLGACGLTNTTAQTVATVSEQFFNSFPGATANPNLNPICTHNLTVSFNGTNVTAQIVDLFPDGPEFNVGLSPPGFTKFATIDQGIVNNVTWGVN